MDNGANKTNGTFSTTQACSRPTATVDKNAERLKHEKDIFLQACFSGSEVIPQLLDDCVLSLFGPGIPTGMNGSLALLSVEEKREV